MTPEEAEQEIVLFAGLIRMSLDLFPDRGSALADLAECFLEGVTASVPKTKPELVSRALAGGLPAHRPERRRDARNRIVAPLTRAG